MVDFMENIFEDDNVQAKLRSEDVRKVDDVIENWQSLYREHEELEDKLKQQQQLYDYKETEFDKLLDQKDETIDQLSSRLVNLQSQLKKFKNSCKKKIEGIQALEEQNDVEDLRENTEVFDLAISEFNERIKECKNELRRISQEKEKEMKDYFELLQDRPDNVYLEDLDKSIKEKKKPKRKTKKKKPKRVQSARKPKGRKDPKRTKGKEGPKRKKDKEGPKRKKDKEGPKRSIRKKRRVKN
ncbi:MAG: hypothetical protein CL470_08985 [Acidimicrobiaceae bacterium]|nr:hypothetical protein [Acidimicrobiaceae bacterium]